MAYADPPYPRKAHLYRGHRDFAGEVDHRELVVRLVDEFPDGWALSTSAQALPDVLELCPRGVRVAAWVKGERAVASSFPLSSWEPVIWSGGRAYPSLVDERRIDSLVHGVSPRTTDPERVIGAKPAAFCYWMFNLLGALPGDEIVDLYPGSGGVARAWAEVTRRVHQVDGSAPAGHDGSPDPHDGSAVATHDGSAAADHDGSGDVDHDGCAVVGNSAQGV